MDYKLHEPHPLAGRTLTERQVRSLWTQGQICQDDVLEEVIDISSEMAILGTATPPERFTGEQLVELCEPIETDKEKSKHVSQNETPAKTRLTIQSFRRIDREELIQVRNNTCYKWLRGLNNFVSVGAFIVLLFFTVILFQAGEGLQIAAVMLTPIGLLFIAGAHSILEAYADIADLLHQIYRGMEGDD